MQPCTGIVGRLFGHDYKPRYSLSGPNFKADAFNARGSSVLVDLIEASKARTYHGDVCRRCGHITNTPPL